MQERNEPSLSQLRSARWPRSMALHQNTRSSGAVGLPIERVSSLPPLAKTGVSRRARLSRPRGDENIPAAGRCACHRHIGKIPGVPLDFLFDSSNRK